MSPKTELTPEEIEADVAARAAEDITPAGRLAKLTYEAALRRSGIGEKTIPGKWEALPSNLRVQWIAGAEIALSFVGRELGATAAATVILGGAPDFEALDRFLDHYSEDPS